MLKTDLQNSGNFTDKIVILHSSLFIRIWQKLIIVLKTFSTFEYSYFAGYRVSGTMNFWQLNWLEIVFLIDFIMTFFVTFPAKSTIAKNAKPVTDMSKIAKNYYQTYLLADLFYLIPF